MIRCWGDRQVIHYLVEVCGLSIRLLDTSMRSALHLACSKGHLATVMYLLKNQVRRLLQFKQSGLAGWIFHVILLIHSNIDLKLLSR